MQVTEQIRGDGSPNLAPGEAASQCSISKPSAAVALAGHLGEGASNKHLRLCENDELLHWIEIAVDDIVDWSAADAGGLMAGHRIIWVRRDADLLECKSVRASSFEQEPTDLTRGGKWPRP